MAQRMSSLHYDVVVVGGGAAGTVAALAASRNGARTLLVESGPMIGGELTSGLPIDGTCNARGEWIIGGIPRMLFDACAELGGYVGRIFDWRTMWIVCLDPEVLKIVLVDALNRNGGDFLLYTFAEDVVMDGDGVAGIILVNKGERTLVTADVIVDCSGDADVAVLAGAPYESGGGDGVFQPVSMVFRMQGVEPEPFLAFVRDHPADFILGENPVINKSREECALELYKAGYPKAYLSAKGPLLAKAIQSGEMYPCAGVAVTPISTVREEVSINSTRIANVDATRTDALSASLPDLLAQVRMGVRFLRDNVPGFSNSHYSGLASRIGVRETRRIIGEYVLTADDVLSARKSDKGVAKGGHHVDIHGSGTYQARQPIRDGGSYDIPYGCLIPRQLTNVLVAGRCLSSTREANGSARVMGTCMAMGQAAGTAAALFVASEAHDVRQVRLDELRATLKSQGAVLDGTY